MEHILEDMVARTIVSYGDDGSCGSADAGLRSDNEDGSIKDQC